MAQNQEKKDLPKNSSANSSKVTYTEFAPVSPFSRSSKDLPKGAWGFLSKLFKGNQEPSNQPIQPSKSTENAPPVKEASPQTAPPQLPPKNEPEVPKPSEKIAKNSNPPPSPVAIMEKIRSSSKLTPKPALIKQQEIFQKSPEMDSRPTGLISNENEKEEGGATRRKKSNSFTREYWMRDDEVKFCYECQTPFSTFIRKHHCRVCGQIFCWRCSQNTIKLSNDLAIRVCNTCFTNSLKYNKSVSSSNLVPKNTMNLTDSVSLVRKEEHEDFLSKTYRPVQLSGNLRSYSNLHEEKPPQTESEKPIPTQPPSSPTTTPTPSMNITSNLAKLFNKSNDNSDGIWDHLNDVPAPSEERPSTTPQTGFEGTSLDEKLNTSQGDPETPIGETPKSDIPKDIIDDISFQAHPRRLRKNRTTDLHLPEEKKEVDLISSPNEEDLKHRKTLTTVADKHLQLFVHQLLQSEQLDQKWFDIIMKIVKRACENIRPQVKQGDKMDIRNYVKVKLIPEGDISETRYIEGVVFNKNLIHKKMRSKIPKPKIFLFHCAIEFQRNRLLVLEDVLSQERSHLKNLIARIAAFEPDLIVVSKTVSRIAQEFLLDTNIAVALNVKPNVVYRLARAIGAEIVYSPTDVTLSNLGAVDDFFVETFKGSWGLKPLMIFDGCPKSAGSSILLRGADLLTLKKVKKVLLFSTYIAYNLQLETCTLFDEFCTLPPQISDPSPDSTDHTDSSPKQKNLLSCTPEEIFPPNLRTQFTTSDSLELRIGNSNPSNQNTAFPYLLPTSSESAEEESNPFALTATPQFITFVEADSDGLIGSPYNDYDFQAVDVNVKSNNPLDQQRIIYQYSLCCTTTSKQCVAYGMHIIDFYSRNDLPVGLFLEKYCFDVTTRCEGIECGRPMVEHERAFVHSNGRLNISVYKHDGSNLSQIDPRMSGKILMWSYCKVCQRVTPFVLMQDDTWNYSFGKFLELSFHGFIPTSRLPECGHSLHKQHTRFFYFNGLIAEFDYEEVDVKDIFVPGPIDLSNSELTDQFEETSIDNVFVVAQEAFNTILKKLNHLEVELKGVREEEILRLMKIYQQEKQQIFDTLDSMKESDIISSSKLHAVQKQLYQNLLNWESTLTENHATIKKLKAKIQNLKPTHHRGLSEDGITPNTNNSNASVSNFSSTNILTATNFDPLSTPGPQNNSPNPEAIPIVPQNHPQEILGRGSSGQIDKAKPIEKPNSNNSNAVSPQPHKHVHVSYKPTLLNGIKMLLGNISNLHGTFFTRPIYLPTCANGKLYLVFEDEPSSLIAYSLSSQEYAEKFALLSKTQKEKELMESISNFKGEKTDIEENLLRANLLSRGRNDIVTKFKYDSFSNKILLGCSTYYSKQFQALRKFFCGGEEEYITSLSRCKLWNASGGKSGSTWSKTLDDRYILKQVSKTELSGFLEVAPLYFEYLSNALFQQVPTILAKIFGIYTLRYESAAKGLDDTQHIIVMENLFYNKEITKKYDLKGSKRARYVRNADENEVLMDENLLEVAFTSPLWVDGASKTTLQAAIWNDSLFLSSIGVMDYSLLVGVYPSKKFIVVGIIDYLRKYTWDKQLETWVKLVGGRGKIPTVISPRQYKIRFREAMSLYFVPVPNKFANLKSAQ